MTRARRGALVCLVIVAALASSACVVDPELIKSLGSIDAAETKILKPVLDDLTRSGGRLWGVGWELKVMSERLAGALITLLMLYLWYLAQKGEPWIGLAKEAFIGSCLAILFITTWDADVGLPSTVYHGIQGAADVLRQRSYGSFANAVLDLTNSSAGQSRYILDATVALGQGSLSEAGKILMDGLVFEASKPAVQALSVFNAIGIAGIRGVLYGMFTVAVVLHWVSAPLFGTMLVLPQTRRVFYGWLQSFVSVCLWPLLMTILDCITWTLPWATVAQSGDYGTGNWAAAAVAAWWRGMVLLGLVEFALVATYLAVPIIASKIVSGSIRATTT